MTDDVSMATTKCIWLLGPIKIFHFNFRVCICLIKASVFLYKQEQSQLQHSSSLLMTETLKIKYFVEKTDPWAQAQTEGWDLFAVRVLAVPELFGVLVNLRLVFKMLKYFENIKSTFTQLSTFSVAFFSTLTSWTFDCSTEGAFKRVFSLYLKEICGQQ